MIISYLRYLEWNFITKYSKLVNYKINKDSILIFAICIQLFKCFYFVGFQR